MKSSQGVVIVLAVLVLAATSAVQAEYAVRDLVGAAKSGDYHAVHFLIEEDVDLEQTDEASYTALRWAAIRGHWRIVAELVAAGASANSIGWDGGSPLHGACHHDNPEAVRRLIEAGADIGLKNQWGRTPLHVAARRDCLAVATLLLDTGADPNATTKEGWTPLHVAARSGNLEMIELLKDRGADPTITDSEGFTAAQSWSPRQRSVERPAEELAQYAGIYDLGRGSFKVWLEGAGLRIREFAPDDLIPVGMDSFQCRREPWKVRFTRNGDGAIDGIEVDFLRRAVRGKRTDAPRYVGSKICMDCHAGTDANGTDIRWMRSRHAHAFWDLGADWALYLALLRPHYQDITSPITDERCVLCHVTGAQDDEALFETSFRPEEGVGCETCHGPGSNYITPEAMSSREAFLAAGGRVPDENTCRSCHRRSENFDWAVHWPQIAHPQQVTRPETGK